MKKCFFKCFFCMAVTALVFISLISCSDSEAVIVSTQGSVVFQYKDEKSSPDVHLAVFVQTQNEAQRAEKLIVKDVRSDRTWTVNKPQLIAGSNKTWAGWSQLYAAPGEKFNNGTYQVTYIDAAGEEAMSAFNLIIPQELFKTKSPDIKEVSKLTLAENCALYDQNMNMLYYGIYKKNWTSSQIVKRDYNRAVYVRRILTNPGVTMVFRLPLEKIDEEKK